MQLGQKIATCCYCGSRTALALRGKKMHELACGNCGAPLHDLKLMPIKPHSQPVKRAVVRPSRVRVKPDDPIKGYKWDDDDDDDDRRRKPKHRKRRGFLSKIWYELKDEIEDIFD